MESRIEKLQEGLTDRTGMLEPISDERLCSHKDDGVKWGFACMRRDRDDSEVEDLVSDFGLLEVY